MAAQSSILPGIQGAEEPGGLQSIGSQKSQTLLINETTLHKVTFTKGSISVRLSYLVHLCLYSPCGRPREIFIRPQKRHG